jgi:hypothetical protein
MESKILRDRHNKQTTDTQKAKERDKYIETEEQRKKER